MNKKIFLVSALVVMAMSAMFVSCKKDSSKDENSSSPTNGCECTVTFEGEKDTDKMSLDDMKKYYGVSSCSALAKAIEEEGADDASCKAY